MADSTTHDRMLAGREPGQSPTEVPVTLEVQGASAGCKVGAREQISDSVRDHGPLMAAVGTYVLTCLALRYITGNPALMPIDGTTLQVAWRYLLIAVALPVSYQLLHFMVTRRRRYASGLAEDWKEYRARHFSYYRLSGLVIACASLATLLGALWAFKRSLPLFSPFVWDERA